MAGLTVRHATASDLDWLLAHDGHLDEPALRRKIRDAEIVVAEREPGELVGLLRLDHLWSSLPHIAQVRVLEAHRRQGVGRALVAFVEAEARRAGSLKLLSSTRPDLTDAGQWHRRLGFVECGSLAGFGPNGEPVIFFLKALASPSALLPSLPMAFVRECRSCHHVDQRQQFEREDDEDARLASGSAWRCPHCGSGDFAMVPAAPIGGG